MSVINMEEQVKETKLSEQNILIYGEPKTGKSTTCSYFDSPLYLATEAGTKHLDLKYAPTMISNWEGMKAACNELSKLIKDGKNPFKTIVIDTIDELDRMCVNYILNREGINELGDIAYGGGYGMVKTELMGLLKGLDRLGLGLVLVSHVKEVEEKEKVGMRLKEWNKKTISVSGSRAKAILAMFDIVMYMSSTINDEGVQSGLVYTKPSMYHVGGDRSKRLPEEIKFNPAEPKTLYNQIAACFD